MLYTLLQWNAIVKVALNTLLVSIPEEAFLVMFTLILAGKFDFLDTETVAERGMVFHKSDLMRILVPVIVSALLSNVLRYAGVDFAVIFPIFLAVMFLLVIIIYRLWIHAKEVGKVFMSLMAGILIMAAVEFSYIPFILYSTGKTVSEINNNVLHNFLISLPERVAEGFIVLLLLTEKATFLRANLIRPILRSRILTFITLTTLSFDIAFMGIIIKVVCYNKILVGLSFPIQLAIIVGNLLFPVINVSALLWGIYYVENKTANREMQVIDMVNYYIENVMKSVKNVELDKVRVDLNSIRSEVSSLRER